MNTIGRNISLTWDGSSIPGVRQKDMSLAGTPVNVSDDEDHGWRMLLEEAGNNEVNLSVSGVTKSPVLRNAWFSGERTKTLTWTHPDGGTLSATFMLINYKENGPYLDAVTFDAEFQSSGVISYVPGV